MTLIPSTIPFLDDQNNSLLLPETQVSTLLAMVRLTLDSMIENYCV